MQTLAFWKTVVMDEANLIERLIELFDRERAPFCVIGGQGVNAYVDPLVSMDLDLVVALADLRRLEPLLRDQFHVEAFAHSLNVSLPESALRVQLQTDPRYEVFLGRAATRDVLGLELPVAAVEDVLQGKVWAFLDPSRRPSKRQKDLADIARLIESRPELRGRVPSEVLARLV